MKKNVLIIENSNDSLSINEEATHVSKTPILGGIFTSFDIKNRNERIYTAEKFLPALEGMQQMMTEGPCFGELDHPIDSFETSLKSASHIIEQIGYVEEDNNVQGKIRLMGTMYGKEAQAILEGGIPLFVSSRAAGITDENGHVTLKKLFSYDLVGVAGFKEAKMSCINESCGYKTDKDTNFRIYEIGDETKINELFNMNNNDMVTKKQLTDYSKYLTEQIGTTKVQVNNALKEGRLDNKKMEELLSYYESLQQDNSKMVKYLDYLAEKLDMVIIENKELKGTTSKLVKHNDYLAENLEKSINYSEYIVENVDKSIKYSEYIAESLEKNIKYSEYIAENLDSSIKYSEYIAENLKSNIEYSEYIAEHVDNNIQYSEYLAENLESNIEYSEYIAENLDDSIAYTDYIAESLDSSIGWSKGLVKKLNENSKSTTINEEMDDEIPSTVYEMPPFEEMEMEEEMDMIEDVVDDVDGKVEDVEDKLDQVVDLADQIKDVVEDTVDDLEEIEVDTNVIDDVMDNTEEMEAETEMETEMEAETEMEEVLPGDVETDEEIEMNKEIEDIEDEEEMVGESITEQIDKLIAEAKKRDVSENGNDNFLKFLNKAQVDSFNSLTLNERENVTLYINEKKNYFSQEDVLKLMRESLEINKEVSLEEKLIKAIPTDLTPVWESLGEDDKLSVLSSARLYPNLVNEDAMSHFWSTRKQLKKQPKIDKKLVSETSLIKEDKLSDNEMTSIMERFKTL